MTDIDVEVQEQDTETQTSGSHADIVAEALEGATNDAALAPTGESPTAAELR